MAILGDFNARWILRRSRRHMHTVLEPKIMSKNYFYLQWLANSPNLNIPKLVSPNLPNFNI